MDGDGLIASEGEVMTEVHAEFSRGAEVAAEVEATPVAGAATG